MELENLLKRQNGSNAATQSDSSGKKWRAALPKRRTKNPKENLFRVFCSIKTDTHPLPATVDKRRLSP